MSPKNQINKFYVGAAHIANDIELGTNDDWTHATEGAAIDHARQILEDDDSKGSVCIVKIIAIVTREKRPIKVKRV